jgi:hypothetical protein
MKSLRMKFAVFGPALVVLLACSADTCSPMFSGAVFTRTHGPDGPILEFAKGRVGIPLPTWWRAYLVVAYRYFEGKPLSVAEARSFAEFYGVEKQFGNEDSLSDAIGEWIAARNQHSKEKPIKVETVLRQMDFYRAAPNCLADAYQTAIKTLQARARRFGERSAELQEWLRGQDVVFSDCLEDNPPPAQLPENANPVLRADRAYQIAAANFYRGKYTVAAAQFDAIAADPKSPWAGIAPYLAVRSLVRHSGGLEALGATSDAAAFKEIQRRLTVILADPKLKRWHHPARMVQNYIAFHLEPEKQQHRLAQHLAGGDTGEDFGQEVRDYAMLLDSFLDEEPDFPNVQRWERPYEEKLQQYRSEQYAARRSERADDLTDWLMTFQSHSNLATAHAVATWQHTRSQAWLVLALSRIPAEHSAADRILQAARAVPVSSAAYPALRYHMARLLSHRGDPDGARLALSGGLNLADLPISTRNLIEDEKLLLAPTRQEFEQLLGRQLADIDLPCYEFGDDARNASDECNSVFYGSPHNSKHKTALPQFSVTAAIALNTAVPVKHLAAIINSGQLPENLRRTLAPAVWLRSALLDEPDAAGSVQDVVTTVRPELEPYVKAYGAEADAGGRRFAAVFAALHFPGLRPFVDATYPRTTKFSKIDDYRDNWWCGDAGRLANWAAYEKEYGDSVELKNSDRQLPLPAFLSTEDGRQAQRESKILAGLGSSDEFLSREVVRWARQHLADPRVPEALHLAVRATRYACGYSPATAANSGQLSPNYSREAFTLLHKNFPRSEWAKKTKYWF